MGSLPYPDIINNWLTSVKCIALKDYLRIQVNIPSVSEQQKIAGVLSLIDEEITDLEKKLEKLKVQKKGLMQKLLTGKIRVKV